MSESEKQPAVEQEQKQEEEVVAVEVAAEVEIPEVIERLPKPDKAAHDAEISKLDAEIKKLQARTVRRSLAGDRGE